MSNIKRELMEELVYTLKQHCKNEDIPEELQAAPDVYEIWKGEWANFQLYDIASELVEDMKRVLQKHALDLLIKEGE